MPSTWSAPTRWGSPSSPGVRSLTTHRSAVVGGVGAHVEPGRDLADGPVQHALGDQPVDQVGQRGLGGRRR